MSISPTKMPAGATATRRAAGRPVAGESASAQRLLSGLAKKYLWWLASGDATRCPYRVTLFEQPEVFAPQPGIARLAVEALVPIQTRVTLGERDGRRKHLDIGILRHGSCQSTRDRGDQILRRRNPANSRRINLQSAEVLTCNLPPAGNNMRHAKSSKTSSPSVGAAIARGYARHPGDIDSRPKTVRKNHASTHGGRAPRSSLFLFR